MIDHKFLTAHFINNEKTTVASQWEDDKGIVRETVTEAEEGNPDWEEILTHVTIDEIHELTYKNIKDQRKSFEDMVMKIAEAEDLVEASRKTDEVELIIDIITTDVIDKEKLFKLKLSLFDMEHVKNSKARANKTALRKAETFVETIAAYSKF